MTSHIKNKHYYCSLSNFARYVVPVLVGLGYKIEFLLIIINCQTTINMSFLNTHALCYKTIVQKKSIFRGANFDAYTDPSFSFPGPLFNKRTDVLPQDLVKSRSRDIGCHNDRIALKFDRHLGSAGNAMGKVQTELVTIVSCTQFQNDWETVK